MQAGRVWATLTWLEACLAASQEAWLVWVGGGCMACLQGTPPGLLLISGRPPSGHLGFQGVVESKPGEQYQFLKLKSHAVPTITGVNVCTVRPYRTLELQLCINNVYYQV